MLNSVKRKIKSALKNYMLAALLVAGTLLLLVVFAFQSPRATRQVKSAEGTLFSLEVADTDALRQQGLSGKHALGQNQGMLFVYQNPGKRCMWMKDMDFPIDMMWLDASKKIIGIEDRIFPSTFPATFCHSASQYVIELSIGRSSEFTIGQQLSF
jgi:uncharacterized protein